MGEARSSWGTLTINLSQPIFRKDLADTVMECPSAIDDDRTADRRQWEFTRRVLRLSTYLLRPSGHVLVTTPLVFER